jgi:hypothetical protein
MQILTSTRAAVLALALAAAPAAAQQTVTVEPAHLEALESRLNRFAATLPAAERAVWDGILRRAAAAPVESAEFRIAPVLQIGPGGGCESAAMPEDAGRVGIIIQGGREAAERAGIIIQGGREAAGREGIMVQGGLVPPRRAGAARTGTAARAPGRPSSCKVSVAANGAPPAMGLGVRVAALAADLPEAERAVINWLLTRSLAHSDVPADTGPVSLRQALGIQAQPPRWVLRY